MDEMSLHAVDRSIFQMKEARTMGPDDGNKSQCSLPLGVGNNKRVDRKTKQAAIAALLSSGNQADERW